MATNIIRGAGMGLRRPLLDELTALPEGSIDFFECAPENWIHVGGHYAKQLRRVVEHTPLILHGLSLNLGGFTPLNTALIMDIKQFIQLPKIFPASLSIDCIIFPTPVRNIIQAYCDMLRHWHKRVI